MQKRRGSGAAKALVECRGNIPFTEVGGGGSPIKS